MTNGLEARDTSTRSLHTEAWKARGKPRTPVTNGFGDPQTERVAPLHGFCQTRCQRLLWGRPGRGAATPAWKPRFSLRLLPVGCRRATANSFGDADTDVRAAATVRGLA